MRGITSGLEPRRYADGDLVQKALDLGVTPFGMSDEEIMQAISQKQQVDDISGASADFEEAGGEGYKMFGKDGLIFDYTNPVDYAMAIPVAGWAGAGIKALSTANKLRKLKKGADTLSKLNNPATRGIATGAFAADLGYDLATDPEMKDIFSNDAVDDAQEDLETVTNDQKEKEEKEKEDANLTDEEKEKKKSFLEKMGQVFEAYGASQGVGGAPKGIEGGMIKGTAINTPEITRYQGGGIAGMMPQEPMMMAGGGMVPGVNGGMVPGYGLGAYIKKKLTDTVKTIVKKAKSEKKPDTKKQTTTKKKTDTKKETGVTKDAPVKEPILPPEFKYIAGAPIGLGKKVFETLGGAGGVGRGAVRAGVYGTAGTMGYNYLDPFGKKTEVEYQGSSEDAAKVNKSESLREFHLENSMARAQEAGRDKPNFMDYLASFPKSYTDKIGSDPEFAQQMMAGFLAMMKPTEGFVPRNAFVDFGEAALAEKARQEGEVPDQLKLMDKLSKDPELLNAFKKYSRSAKPLTATELETEMMAVERMLKKSIYGDNVKDDDKIYKRPATEGEALGMPIAPSTLYQMYLDAGENLEAVREKVTGDGS
jgi:hypothetical protein